MTTVHPSTSPAIATTVQTTRPRMTPEPAGRAFRRSLEGAATGLLARVDAAAGLAPGGAVVAAAVRNGDPTLASPESPALGQAGMVPALGGIGLGGADQSMALLELQQRMSLEQRQYMAVSNAIKAKHDTAKNVLGNVR